MRVAIDISPLHQFSLQRGVGSYTYYLVQALQALHDGNEYLLTRQHTLRDIDVIHYPFFDLFFLTLPLIPTKPVVVTIHDVIPLRYVNYYRPGLRGKLKFMIQTLALKSVRAIITDSETSKKDIQDYLEVDESKILPIYLAAATKIVRPVKQIITNVLTTYHLTKPYLLYVGDINYNKNVVGLLKTFSRVKFDYHLVLVSRALDHDTSESREIKKRIKTLGIASKVHCLTQVPSESTETLSALYAGADWYIQPSFYEGFGLPVLEAMQCGTPVVCSTGGSLPEVAGNAALMFNPTKANEMEDILNKALHMKFTDRKKLIQKGLVQAKSFSWQNTARQTRTVYQSIL